MVKITVREALNKALEEELRRDDSVYVMGEEVAEYQGAYKITQDLLEKFGNKRIIDTPISEHAFTGLSVGSAFVGLRPIVEFMSFNFSMQAIDHIINSATKTSYMSGGKIHCPIVFRGPNGVAAQVAAQHSQCFASWYAHIPGLVVITPNSVLDHKGLLKSAVQYNGPVIFLEHELLYGISEEVNEKDFENENFTIPIGEAKILQEGNDITIVSFSMGVKYALESAKILEKEHNINAEVIDLRTIHPLDTETLLKSVKKTNRIISIEEGWSRHGIGAEISAIINEKAFDYLDAPCMRASGLNVPMPYAKNLEKMALPITDSIISKILKSF
ncbi:pyruvate dehydrogenase complex E1 component subunit beta [Anaplasmataceae bacterium AB001_6]|nr:pyruvate dehydrogenase complex E1 component subunit beta [Anaplasmataceae bacterium AB001_6]